MNYRIQHVRSTDGGASFLTASTLSDAGRDADTYQIALDASGNPHVVWRRYDGTNYRVQHVRSTNGGASFLTVSTLGNTQEERPECQIALDASGNPHVVWNWFDGAKDRIQYVRSTDGGASFLTASTLSDAGQHADVPQIALDASGNPHVVWSRSDGTFYRIQHVRSTDGGASFLTVSTLSDAGQTAVTPQIALSP